MVTYLKSYERFNVFTSELLLSLKKRINHIQFGFDSTSVHIYSHELFPVHSIRNIVIKMQVTEVITFNISKSLHSLRRAKIFRHFLSFLYWFYFSLKLLFIT